MSDMSQVLAEVFNTGATKTASAEDLEKQAQVEFFNGICQSRGINIDELTDGQVENLWKVAMDAMDAEEEEEEAEEEEKEQEKEEKKAAAAVASAQAAWSEKRAAAVKVAEAEAMGRIMAHAYVDELRKLAGEMPEAFKEHAEKSKKKGDEKDSEEGDEEKTSADRAASLIAELQAKTAAPAAGAQADFEELAAYQAIDLLKHAGVAEDLAFKKIDAVFTLGLEESSKTAAVSDFAQAVYVRGLEYCEAAGFPVNWE